MASEPGLNLRFQVTIDRQRSLGNWAKCEGLTVELEVHEYREGGQNGFVHRIPGRRKYQNIKLTRPLDKSSKSVADWIATLGGPTAGHTAQISVFDADGQEVTSWDFADIYLARWQGPTLDVNGREIANEVLELGHNGFLGAA